MTEALAPAARFSLLGPLAVRRGAGRLRISAPMHRAVLAILLIRANQPVTADLLVDQLWDGREPKTARKTMQGYVWRLRGALGSCGDRLVTEDGLYRILVEPGQLDSVAFDDLVERSRAALRAGEPARAAGLVDRALALWHGPALANVPGTALVAAHAARLEETRLAAEELRADIELARGRHAHVVPDLAALAIRWPARESAHRLLMVALYRAGRQTDALAVYARLREFLVGEYGVEPSARTRDLQRRILGRDGTLETLRSRADALR
jgi:DNA-binding SARP family transcriptional activator